MAFNPFLMETDYTAQSSAAASMYTNPAPSGGVPMDTGSSNPFLSFGAGPEPAASMPPVSNMGSYMDPSIYGGGAVAATGDNPFLSYDMGQPVAEAASSNPFADYSAPEPVVSHPFSSQMSIGGTAGANAYFASTADMSYAHQTTMVRVKDVKFISEE